MEWFVKLNSAEDEFVWYIVYGDLPHPLMMNDICFSELFEDISFKEIPWMSYGP